MAILVVDDESRVRSFVERGLSEEGLATVSVGTAADADAALAAGGVEVIVLDWMLEEESGLSFLKRLRASEDVTPVIMLTARDAVRDRVEALNAGADDYLVKPFAFAELVARVRAALRRGERRPTPVLSCADLVLDPVAHVVTRAGKAIRLTAREFALLHYLLRHAGEPVTRTRIVEAVWDHDFDTFSNVVDVYVRYL